MIHNQSRHQLEPQELADIIGQRKTDGVVRGVHCDQLQATRAKVLQTINKDVHLRNSDDGVVYKFIKAH